MEKDTIIEEIHKVRKEYAERFGNDLHAICQDAMHKQGGQGRHVVFAIPKPVSIKSFVEMPHNNAMHSDGQGRAV